MSLSGRLAVSGLVYLASMKSVFAQARYNLPEPVTPVAWQIYDLHTLMMIICVVIFVAVFGVMFYSIYAHRKSRGAVAANFHEHTGVEILWTIIPVFILIGMAWPATKTIIEMRDSTESDLTVKATGYQWQWGYDYVVGEGEGISFMSALSTPRPQIRNNAAKGRNYLLEVDNPLVVPVGKKVRVLLTANDVIHSWWVPALGVKQDAVPGFIRNVWFLAEKEGVYRGVCAELCGRDHGFMPIEVHVVSEKAYAAWTEEQLNPDATEDGATAAQGEEAQTQAETGETPSTADAAAPADGADIYAKNCVACHQSSGEGMPPAFPPLAGADIVNGEAAAMLEVILKGRPGTAMAPFGHFSDEQIAALATYIRGSWGNSGDEVTAEEVAAER